jgi:hypothetical protein
MELEQSNILHELKPLYPYFQIFKSKTQIFI